MKPWETFAAPKVAMNAARARKRNKRFMMRLCYNAIRYRSYYGDGNHLPMPRADAVSALRVAIFHALRRPRWKSVFDTIDRSSLTDVRYWKSRFFSVVRVSLTDARSRPKLVDYIVDYKCLAKRCNEILKVACVVIEQRLTSDGWAKLVAFYAYVVYLACPPPQTWILCQYGEWAHVANSAGVLFADKCARWLVECDYDWNGSFVRYVYDDVVGSHGILRTLSYDCPFGADVQLYAVDPLMVAQTRSLLTIIQWMTSVDDRSLDRVWSGTATTISAIIRCGDRCSIRVFCYGRVPEDGDVINADATRYIVVDGNAPMPYGRLEPYALRFDVGAFRRDFEPHWARVLTNANVLNVRLFIERVRVAENDQFLQSLAKSVLEMLPYDKCLVYDELSRLMGVKSLSWSIDSPRWTTADAFPIRSSPFRLLADCVAYVGSTDSGDMTLQRLAAVAALRAGTMTNLRSDVRQRVLCAAEML